MEYIMLNTVSKGVRAMDKSKTEQKLNVVFYTDDRGIMWQELLERPDKGVFKVKDGAIGYMLLNTKGKYSLKYNLNGIYGYTIMRGTDILEDNIWSYKQAQHILNTIN